jgi:hypothetical protein
MTIKPTWRELTKAEPRLQKLCTLWLDRRATPRATTVQRRATTCNATCVDNVQRLSIRPAHHVPPNWQPSPFALHAYPVD